MRRVFIGFGALVFVATTQGCGEKPASRGEKTFLWKVGAGSGSVYLLGSVHMGMRDLYPLARPIEEAFEKSRVLVIEADEGRMDPAGLQRLLNDRGLYPPGESLSSKLSKEKLKNVQALVEKLGLPMEQAERMRPWFLAMNATSLVMQKLGYDPALGIDRHFMAAARGKKEIKELESVEFQINLLAGLSEDVQDLFVSSTLDEIDGVKERMEKVFAAWKKGDDHELNRLMITEGMAKKPELAPLMKTLLDDRNEGMVRKIEAYLKTGEIHFVVAGAAHMVGERGICELLRKKGYTVEQIGQ